MQNQNEMTPIKIMRDGLCNVGILELSSKFENIISKEKLETFPAKAQVYFINTWLSEELSRLCGEKNISVTEAVTCLPLTEDLIVWSSVINEGILPFLKKHY